MQSVDREVSVSLGAETYSGLVSVCVVDIYDMQTS